MRIAILVAYDGTDFSGWQVQPKKRTVQGVLEEALSRALGKKVVLTASGRTDAGVHAFGQVCHFDAETTIPASKIADCANPLLPGDVKVLKSKEVPPSFDANRTARRKTYRYTLYLSEREHPLYERYAVRLKENINLDRVREAAHILEGEHDFKAFCASGSSAKTTIRTVYACKVEREGNKLSFVVTGNGFLYNMVRTIAGELLDIGRGRLTVSDLKRTLETGERKGVGKTMPAKGLALESVEYEDFRFEG